MTGSFQRFNADSSFILAALFPGREAVAPCLSAILKWIIAGSGWAGRISPLILKSRFCPHCRLGHIESRPFKELGDWPAAILSRLARFFDLAKGLCRCALSRF